MSDDLYDQTPWRCARCDFEISLAVSMSGAGHGAPEEGSGLICQNCGATYEMRQGQWRPLTDAEIAALPPTLRRELLIIEAVRRRALTSDLTLDRAWNDQAAPREKPPQA